MGSVTTLQHTPRNGCAIPTAKEVAKTPALAKTNIPSRVSSPFQRRLRPAIRPAHIGLSIRPSRETHGFLPGLGDDALRANSLKVTRSPRYGCLARKHPKSNRTRRELDGLSGGSPPWVASSLQRR